jgi:hypothetical protein
MPPPFPLQSPISKGQWYYMKNLKVFRLRPLVQRIPIPIPFEDTTGIQNIKLYIIAHHALTCITAIQDPLQV